MTERYIAEYTGGYIVELNADNLADAEKEAEESIEVDGCCNGEYFSATEYLKGVTTYYANN